MIPRPLRELPRRIRTPSGSTGDAARLLRMERDVYRVMATASDVETALQRVLEALVVGLGCAIGRAWTCDGGPGGGLRRASVWGDPDRLHATAHAAVPVPAPNLPQPAVDAAGPVLWVPLCAGREVIALLELRPPAGHRAPPSLPPGVVPLTDAAGSFLARRRAQKEVRRRREELQDLFENASDLIQILRADGRVVYANRAWRETLGYREEDTFALQAVDFIHARDLATYRAACAQALGTAGQATVQMVFVARDGSETLVEGNLSPGLEDVGPGVVRGIFRDVTARVLAELEQQRLLDHRREQVERLRELDRLKDEFVSLVSHELRTPITSIRGYLELLLDDDAPAPPAEQRRWLEVVDRNAERLGRVVADLLFISRLDAGTLHFERGPADLGQIVGEAVESARPFAGSRDVEIVLVDAVEAPLCADAARLAQLVDNLLSNAVKFTPPGGRVTVRLAVEEDGIVFEVTDSGIGIPADEREGLFERFFRTSNATANAIPGTGLGLAISRAIVEGHDGRIEVESGLGRGTTMRVMLPAAREGCDDGPADAAA